MIEVWKINPNCWNVDAQGMFDGYERIRLISRHRKAARALAVVESARDLVAFKNGEQLSYYALCDLALG